MSFILAVFLAVAQAQAPPPPSPESTVLTYERFLRESEEQHRKYIETLLTGAAALVTLFTAYLGWLNWKTRKELLAEIQAEYHEAAEKVARKYESEAFKGLEERIDERIKELDLNLAQKTAAAGAPVAQAASGPPRKILWVDDHQWNNSEVELIESRWPVDIDRALSTDEAMQKLQSTAYDLVIEDMDRRGNNRAGIELLEKLRDEKKDIPVVVYTSSASARRYGAEARRLGAKKVTASAVALMDAIQSIFG